MAQFVILTHTFPHAHWDLMLENAAGLRTWRLDLDPEDHPLQPASPLPVHRIDYLEYEGPVSGNRGEVRRWDRGTFTGDAAGEHRIQVQLEGERMQGTLLLECGNDPEEPWNYWFVRLRESRSAI